MQEEYKYLIIGGGVAGTSAAESIRQIDAEGSLAIISDEPYRLYSRIMLSKPSFFLEKIPFDSIWLKNENWYRGKKIDQIFGKKAVALDAKEKTVKLSSGEAVAYDKLLLALGVYPFYLDIPGNDLRGVLHLRSLDDGKKIIAGVKKTRRAVVVGGGFIGFEMCDLFRMSGHDVTLVIREPHYWDPVLDKSSGRMIERALEKGGVKIIRNRLVKEFSGKDNVEKAVLDDGTRLACDMVVEGVGCFSPHKWVADAGIEVKRGILADEYLETSARDIWTAGDVAEFNDVVLGEQVQLGNWVNAQMQGKVAGANMAGKNQVFRFVSFYTTVGFGITIGFVGDVSPGLNRDIIPRGSPEINSYARLIVKEDELVGATLINRSQELGIIGKIIEKDVKVADKYEQLADPNFDLKKLLE